MRAGRLAAAAVICLGATTVGAAAHAQDVGDELTIEEMQLLDAAYRSTRDVERIDRSTSTVLGEPADVEGPVLAAGSRYTAVEPEDIVRYLEVISEAARVASSPGPIEVLSTGSAAYFSTTVGGTIVTIVTPEPTSACDAGFVYQEFAVFWAIDGLPVVAPVDGYVDPGVGATNAASNLCLEGNYEDFQGQPVDGVMSQTANAIPKWQVHVDDEYHTSFVLPGGGYTTWVAASFADEFALDAIHVQRGPDMTTPNVADDVEVDRAEFDAWIADILAPPVDPGLDALCSAVDVELIGGSTCPFAPATESTCSAAGGTWEPPACSFGLAPEDCALIGLASDDGLCVPTDEPVVVGTCTALGGEPVGLGCEVAVDAGRCTAATGRVVPSGGCTLTSPPTEATCSALGTGFAWDDVCRFSLDEPLLEPLDESAPDVGGDLAVADEEPTGGDDLTVDDEVADAEPAPVAAATETVVDAPGDGTSGSLLAVLLLALVGAIVVAFLGWLLWWRPRRSGSSGAPVETQVEPMMASVTDGVAASAAGSGVETQVEPIMAGVPDRVVGRSADVESGDDDDDDDGEASEVDALLGMPEIAAAAATQDALEDAGEPTEDWAYADDPLAGEPADPPPVRATIWVVDERNTATRHVLRQQPFSVVAVAPDDGTAPDMVEALLQIGDQSAPITLARVGSDDPGIATYRYNSAPLDDDWELGGHEVTNGMRVTISAESFVPFAGRAHSEVASRDLSLALQHLEAAGDAWRGVLAALPAIESQADGRIDTERLRAVAAAYVRMVELALPVIERHSHHVWGSVLEDDRIELGKAVAAAEAAVYRIPLDPLEAFGSGATPLVLIAGDGRFVDELELAVETQHARTRDAFVGVVGGSLITGYRTFAAMSGGDIWWAIATGTDEMGAARSRWDVAEDLLVEVLIGHLIGLGMRGITGGPDLPLNTTSTRRKVPRLTQTSQPERIRSGPPAQGAIVDAAAHGVRNDLLDDLRRIASELGVVLGLRPGNIDSMSWQALGHTVKNTEIKSKTLGPRDDFIGGPLTSGQAVGPDKPYGLVGYFDPKLPSRPDGISDADWDLLVDGGRRPPGMPEGEWDAVKQEFTADVHRILDGYVPAGAAADVAAQIPGRFAQRRLEFEDNAAWYGQLVDEGKIEIRDGVVWNTGLYRGKHAGITGDIDVFEVFGLDGRPLEIEQYIEAMEYLKAHPELLIRHGAHMRWPIEFPFENSKDKGIFTVIVKSHEGKEPILLVGGYGDGLIRATYTRNGSLVTATDGRVLWSPDGGWIAPHSFGAPTHVGVAVQVASALPSAAGVDGDSGRPDRPAPTRRAVDETSNSVPADRTGQADVDDDGAELGMVDEAPRSEPDHVWRWPQVSYFRELIDAAAEAAIAGGRPVTSDGWTWLTAGEWWDAFPSPVGAPWEEPPSDPDRFQMFVNIHTGEELKIEGESLTEHLAQVRDRPDAALWQRLAAELPDARRREQGDEERQSQAYDGIELNEATLASASDRVIDL